MISRRQLLLTVASVFILPAEVLASSDHSEKISWPDFQLKMKNLADAEAARKIGQKAVAERGLQLLNQLDISSTQFRQAIADSYETGNHYWLWQRLMKAKNINGGILNIDSKQLVQLHDHPGATGMVRIISGEVEVWQFDNVTVDAVSLDVNELKRVSHNILRAGDIAVLTPDKGNIHALRSISKTCSMLDFFIPPYEKSQRNWFEPLEENWFDKENILCRRISQDEYLAV